MRVKKGQVRAPEIGRVWLNSPPLSFRQLRGRVVLVDFWDYTCVNCIRTLPYVQAWHERYRDLGLTVIGVHTPEFTFAQYESNVERGVKEFGLTYPIVIDSNFELWKAFAEMETLDPPSPKSVLSSSCRTSESVRSRSLRLSCGRLPESSLDFSQRYYTPRFRRTWLRARK